MTLPKKWGKIKMTKKLKDFEKKFEGAKKTISAEEYNNLMERVIRLNKKLEVHEQLIKILEEASKYKIRKGRNDKNR